MVGGVGPELRRELRSAAVGELVGVELDIEPGGATLLGVNLNALTADDFLI